MKSLSIDEYISSISEDGSKAVREFMEFMNIEFPGIIPKICFSMPMWWAGAKMYDGYVAVSAAKKHYSIHFHDEDRLRELSGVLPECKFGRKCINIKYNDDGSIEAVKRSVKGYFNTLLETKDKE